MFNSFALPEIRSSKFKLTPGVTTLHCSKSVLPSSLDISTALETAYLDNKHLKTYYLDSSFALESKATGGKEEITLRQVFDEIFDKFRFDSNFAKRINAFQVGFVNRNQDHLEFFGGNLLGVQVIRFKDSDVNKFFDEVIDQDYDYVEKRVRTVTDIDHTYKIAGDIFNLTLSYVLHRCLTSDFLVDQKRHRAALDTALIFFYRSICAVHSYYFKYPFDPKIAQEAYARLSGKFLIKQLGSWQEVMLYRSDRLIERGSVHLNELIRYDNDDAIVYMIEDSQGRIKDLVKNYAIELYKVHEEGANIATTSSTMLDADGEVTIRDKVGGVDSKVQILRGMVGDKNAFIKDEYVSVIAKTNTNTSARIVKHTLGWMCDNVGVKKYSQDIDDFISKVVVQTMYMIENNIPINKRRDVPYILKTIKDLYLSTRTTDRDILEIREIGDRIIGNANGRVSTSLALSTRTSVILYIALLLLAAK